MVTASVLEESLAIARKLAQADPDAHLFGLGRSLASLALAYSLSDRDEEASRLMEEVDAISQRLGLK
jgi:hypothetical protein